MARSPDAPHLCPELSKLGGLDRSLPEQYGLFLGNLLSGDFGQSYVFRQPALDLIVERLPATLELVAVATVLVVAIPLGAYAGANPGSRSSRGIMAGSLLRITHAGMMEVSRQDDMKFARAKGVSRRDMLYGHGLKNALILITHELAVVGNVVDRITVLHAGRVVEQGRRDAVLRTPRRPYTEGLIGSVPSLHDRKPRLAQIPGTVPDVRNLPAGCAFRDRCARAPSRCATERPELRAMAGSEQRVACQFPVRQEVPA